MEHDRMTHIVSELQYATEGLLHMPWVFWSTLLNLGLLVLLARTLSRAHAAEQRADAESAEVRRLCERRY